MISKEAKKALYKKKNVLGMGRGLLVRKVSIALKLLLLVQHEIVKEYLIDLAVSIALKLLLLVQLSKSQIGL